MTMKRLINEYKTICNEINTFYSIAPSDESLLKWNFSIIGPPDTIYEGGIFAGYINFPVTYPISPPTVYFDNMIHPNVFKNGVVCISILHQGIDSSGYEKTYERWTPTHTVDSIMVSIISMLTDPNFNSPANLDWSKMWQHDPDNYKHNIYKLVATTQKK